MAGESGTQEEQAGVDLAYDLMQSSYDWIVTRLNAVEGRIQALMVFSASFLFTAPVLVATAIGDVALDSPVFILAVILAGLNLIAGTVTRARDSINLPRVYGNVHEWMDLPPYWFKFYAVEEAAKHFEDNVRTVNRKGAVTQIMTILFLLETILLAAWGLSQIG